MVSGSDGKKQKTPQYAQIAAKLRGVPTRRHKAWFAAELGIELSPQQAERASSPIRQVSELMAPRGRPGKRRIKAAWVIRDWLDVREERFGLLKVLVTVKGEGRSPGMLMSEIAALPGIRTIAETSTSRDLVATALFRDTLEEQRLRARIEELTERQVVWDHVRAETSEPARRTWAHLARMQANEEEFPLSPDLPPNHPSLSSPVAGD